MSKRLYTGLTIAALILSNSASYWLGKESQVVTFEKPSGVLDFPLPSKESLRAACAHMYIVDEEKDGSSLVRVTDAQGLWNEVTETILCSVKSDHLIKRNGHILNQPGKHAFFTVGKECETVTRHITESDFKKRVDNQNFSSRG